MSTRKDNEFLNGVPELLLLRLLERRPMYGYQLVQAIKLATGDVLAFGEGCVYPVLHRLEAADHLEAAREQVAGRSRVVYRLTDAGRRRLGDATARWSRVAEAVAAVLKGGGDVAADLA
jgi:PadR family transcriptional regulator, regulatory protein PadR